MGRVGPASPGLACTGLRKEPAGWGWSPVALSFPVTCRMSTVGSDASPARSPKLCLCVIMMETRMSFKRGRELCSHAKAGLFSKYVFPFFIKKKKNQTQSKQPRPHAHVQKPISGDVSRLSYLAVFF